jgi:hypothetical protein
MADFSQVGEWELVLLIIYMRRVSFLWHCSMWVTPVPDTKPLFVKPFEGKQHRNDFIFLIS